MEMTARQVFSPKSSSGSWLYSIAVHGLAFAALTLVFHLSSRHAAVTEEYVDMSYQQFDEPPQIAKVEQRVRRTEEVKPPPEAKAAPDTAERELQDDKGPVAGTQVAKTEAPAGATTDGVATATPYYKIKPKYPRAALVEGIEGWVLLHIDVTEQGTVENVRVVDGEQRNMFSAEAKRAVEQWRYRPFLDKDGKPIHVVDKPVRVDFKLNDIGT